MTQFLPGISSRRYADLEVAWLANRSSGEAEGPTVASLRDAMVGNLRMDQRRLEAPPGFEPGMEVLQTSALPLGDGAGWN